MFKKITIAFLVVFVLMLASVGADTLIKNIQATTMPVNIYFDGEQSTESKTGQYFNGQKYVPLALFYEGTTYVPLRYVGESFGKEVGWDQASRSVWVGKKPASFTSSSSTTTGNTTNEKSILGIYVGQSDTEVTKILGKPSRIDPSNYGYEWWIYNQDLSRYIQVGIKNNKVVDVYSNSTKIEFSNNIKIGSTKDDLRKAFSLYPTIDTKYDNADFSIENDLYERPIIFIDGTPYIFYLDIHDGDRITAIRSLTVENLVKNGLYNFKYSYYVKPNLSIPVLSKKEQNLVELATEKQIFDLTNSIRFRNGLPLLAWNEEAANVARSHSLDMLENDFFEHTSPTTGLSSSQRLKQAGIDYIFMSENIAMNFSDGMEAFEGWMNSTTGHRENILDQRPKTLGVGVKEAYYTQNFVTYRNK